MLDKLLKVLYASFTSHSHSDIVQLLLLSQLPWGKLAEMWPPFGAKTSNCTIPKHIQSSNGVMTVWDRDQTFKLVGS